MCHCSYEQCGAGRERRLRRKLRSVRGFPQDSKSPEKPRVAGGHCSQNSGTAFVSINRNKAPQQSLQNNGKIVSQVLKQGLLPILLTPFAKVDDLLYSYYCSIFSDSLFTRICPFYRGQLFPNRLALRGSICCPTGRCGGVFPRPNGPVGRWRRNVRHGPREPYDPTTLPSAQVQAGRACQYRKIGRHAWTHAH